MATREGPFPPKGNSSYIPLSYLTPRDSLHPQSRYRDLDPPDDGSHQSHGFHYIATQSAPIVPIKGKYTAVATTIDECEPDPNPPAPPEARQEGPWQPWWLRRLVFALFFSIFSSLAALVVLLYVFSQRNNGLFNADPAWTYIWRFGPTAVLTVVASVWSRVELQALRYMPWIAMADGRPLGPNGYALDYTAMLSPMAIIHSVKCRHGLVSVVAISSLLLKGMIVLAPGLFRLATVEFPTPVAIRLSDTFVDRFASSGNYADSSPFYIRKAVQEFNMSFPFGATETVAYQKFQPADKALGSRGSQEAPLRVVVDGFTAEIECRKMESHRADIAFDKDAGSLQYMTDISIDFEGCDQAYALPRFSVGWSHSSTSESSSQNLSQWINLPGLNANTGCSSLPPSQPQFLYFAGVFESSPQNASVPVLAKAAAVICAPKPQVLKVEVTDDGVSTAVRRLPDQDPHLFTSDYTKLLRGSVPTGLGEWNQGTGVVTGPVTIEMDFRHLPVDNDDPSLYETDFLHDAILSVFKRLGGLIGHFSLKEEGGPEVTGTRLLRIERLVVDRRAAFSIAAISVAVAGLMLWSFVGIAPKAGISPRDPATLLGGMLFLKDNPGFLDLNTSIKSASTPKDEAAADWSTTEYSSLLVRTWFRCILFVLLVVVIGGLLVLLRKSQASNGLATVEDEEYLHLLWTSLPTLVMVVVSVSIVSANGAVRNLAVFSALSTRSVTSRELDVALIDMYGPRVWYHSVRMKAYIVTLSEALAVLAGFLTIIVSTVFVVNYVPESHNVQLARESWFGARDFGNLNGTKDVRATIGSLLLRSGISNFSYPPNTYDDLIFPVLAALPPDPTVSGNIITEAKLPAVRLESKCSPLLESEYSISVDSYTEGNDTFFEATVKQHIKCPGEETVKDWPTGFFLSLDPSNLPDVSHVAGRLASPENPFEFDQICLLPTPEADKDNLEYPSWRVVTYFWGRSTLAEKRFDFHTAHRCNYSWVAVDTAVVLLGVDRRFDRNHPPTPDEATKRAPEPLFPIPHIDVSSTRYTQGVGPIFPQINLLNHSDIAAFRPGFLHLLQPYGPFAQSAFGDPAAIDDILANLTGDYAFLAAQIASVENRLRIGELSFREPREPAAVDVAPVTVTVVDQARRRLVQNATPTWALVGILSFAAAVNGWALLSTALRRRGLRGRWLLNMDLKGLAPEGVGSIAIVARLLVASNAFSFIPSRRPAQWLPLEEMHRVFAQRGFRLGWFRRPGGQGMVYTVGVIDDDRAMEFLGSKWDMATKEAPAKRYPGGRKGDSDRVPLRAAEFPVFRGR